MGTCCLVDLRVPGDFARIRGAFGVESLTEDRFLRFVMVLGPKNFQGSTKVPNPTEVKSPITEKPLENLHFAALKET